MCMRKLEINSSALNHLWDCIYQKILHELLKTDINLCLLCCLILLWSMAL